MSSPRIGSPRPDRPRVIAARRPASLDGPAAGAPPTRVARPTRRARGRDDDAGHRPGAGAGRHGGRQAALPQRQPHRRRRRPDRRRPGLHRRQRLPLHRRALRRGGRDRRRRHPGRDASWRRSSRWATGGAGSSRRADGAGRCCGTTSRRSGSSSGRWTRCASCPCRLLPGRTSGPTSRSTGSQPVPAPATGRCVPGCQSPARPPAIDRGIGTPSNRTLPCGTIQLITSHDEPAGPHRRVVVVELAGLLRGDREHDGARAAAPSSASRNGPGGEHEPLLHQPRLVGQVGVLQPVGRVQR